MKKKTVVCLMALMLLAGTALGQGKATNLVGTMGMAAGNGERLIASLGIETEVFRHFFAQVSFDGFLVGNDWSFYAHDEGMHYTPVVRDQVFGVNLLGTFKVPLRRRTAWFARAGLSYSFHSSYYDDNYFWGYDDYWYEYSYDRRYRYHDRPYSREEGPEQTGLAYALGTGIEYRLSDKLALLGGGTYEALFDPDPSPAASGDGDWVKIYVGISYRVR